MRDDGAFDLDRYDSNGTLLRRYIGFSRITAVRMYDHHTALIAEEERVRISALTLGGPNRLDDCSASSALRRSTWTGPVSNGRLARRTSDMNRIWPRCLLAQARRPGSDVTAL
jgi:hypothetical protein